MVLTEKGAHKLGAYDGLALEASEVVHADDVAHGVHGLTILFVNLFAVRSETDAHDWVLIDTGLPLSAWRVRRWVRRHFGDVPPRAILLTHGHFDHVGAVRTLADEWDVPVYAHRRELPFLNGQCAYPPPDPTVGGGAMARLSPLYPSSPIDIVDRLCLLEGDSGALPPSVLPGWRWIHTPGHTDGHVSFFRDADRTLLVGDAFCTTKQESFFAVARQAPELHGPPAYYTSDWVAAKHSVDLLAALKPLTLAPGHGPCIAGPDVALKLVELAADFDRLALPEHGRYVPASTAASRQALRAGVTTTPATFTPYATL